MEEEKLVRKKKKAVNGSNRRILAESCNDLATYYYKLNKYSDALDEYKQEAGIYKDLGLRMEWGTCSRMIAEMYTLMAEFEKALKYEERHLAVARELNDLVEEQRAISTLGRIYLLQGQSSNDEDESKMSLKAAEKAFMKGLLLCEKLNGKINKHELMDMRSRLLLNIGVIQEHLGHFEKALECINKAISICSNQDLYEVLHNCYTTAAQLYANKRKDYTNALSCLSKALEVAKRLEDKVLKTCETLASKGDILCKMSDYQSAKQVLYKAWKLQTPDEEEKENIENNLRVVAAMCYTEDLLISTNPTDHGTFKKLYEKLGDGACHLKNYDGGVEYYLNMLDHAMLAGESGKGLIPIYVSLYQTYKDMGHYNEALDFCQKEYDLIKDVPKEAFTTLCNIAEIMFLAKKPYGTIEKACLEARKAAQDWGKRKYEIRILKTLLKYQEEYMENEKMEQIKNDLRDFGYDDFDNLDNSDDEQSSAGCDDDTHIGDDICLENLTDLSDTNEEEVAETKRVRKRGTGFAIKKNMKGETQLHVACISGNKLLVERLLAKGHPVNVRDNAGWLPLHEACIHGHLEVANILINNGANVNDRGGSNCDGITPLYDAASNGHLEVVQLLIEKGAIPTLKTDFGETPLNVLQKWRQGTILTKDQEIIYKNICNRIHSAIDKTNTADVIGKAQCKTPVKKAMDTSPPSTSKMTTRTGKQISPVFKKRNIIDTESDDDTDCSRNDKNEAAFTSNTDDSSDEKSVRGKRKIFTSDDSNDSCNQRSGGSRKISGVKEYRSAISALRNRSTGDVPADAEIKKPKPKPALLDSEEVDDDWLEDDLGINNKPIKKRKLNDPLNDVVVKPVYESLKDSIDKLNKIQPLVNNNSNEQKQKRLRVNSIVEIDDSHNDNFQKDENISPKKALMDIRSGIIRDFNTSRDSRDGMKKRWKRQSTLLKAGFQRKREDDQSSNSGSDCEFKRDKPVSHSPIPFCRKSSGDLGLNINPGIIQPVNVIQPINIVQSSKNGRQFQTQIMQPAAVKVQVEDKVLLISLKLDTINKLTISWLVEEVKSRYYKLTGVRPVFSLLTSDGAILSEDDPLSLVLSSPELKTCITNWKASPAEERYLECCEALGIPPSDEIQQAVGRSHTTHRLALGSKTLSTSQIRPLFRALTHQTHITAIMVSDNNIGDDGIKYLVETLCTLKQLTHLDLSNNHITQEGTKKLLELFDKATRPVCQLLDELDLSHNKIGDIGFRNIVNLCQHVKLKVLKLNYCGITQDAVKDVNMKAMNLDYIEVIDVSNNQIGQATVSCLMTSLNSNSVTDLELDNVGVAGSVVGCIASFMDSAKELKMRRLALSNCNLVDGQFMRIYRSIGRAKHLQSITLKQNHLTFITLKKLLQRQPPVPQINLQDCQDIFKYSPDSDFQVWLPAIDFGRCIPEINVTPVFKTDSERDSFKLFSKTWLNCFKGRGVIEHCDGGVIKFTAR